MPGLQQHFSQECCLPPVAATSNLCSCLQAASLPPWPGPCACPAAALQPRTLPLPCGCKPELNPKPPTSAPACRRHLCAPGQGTVPGMRQRPRQERWLREEDGRLRDDHLLPDQHHLLRHVHHSHGRQPSGEVCRQRGTWTTSARSRAAASTFRAQALNVSSRASRRPDAWPQGKLIESWVMLMTHVHPVRICAWVAGGDIMLAGHGSCWLWLKLHPGASCASAVGCSRRPRCPLIAP